MAGGGYPFIPDIQWPGQTFDPPTLLDITSIEAEIVAQLKLALGNVVDVAHFPDKPEAYRLTHRIGTVLVMYTGAEYGKILDTGHVVQERTMEFVIGMRIRDLGWAYGGPPSGTSPGAYQIIEGIRLALIGFQPSTGCTRMMPKSERFVDRDKEGGVWVYEIVFVTRTMSVESYEPPKYPLFTHGTALEEGGQTFQVQFGLFTFTGSPGTITLGQSYVSALVVKSQNLLTVYVVGIDYTADLVNGIITRITTGGISPAATVAVSYGYADVVTALASGGSVPFAPNN